MSARPIEILMVEDNPSDADFIRETLSESLALQFEITHFERLDHTVSRLEEDNNFDLVLLDLSLPDSSGLDTFREVQRAADELPIVVLTGLDDEEVGLQAIQEGAQDYLVKSEVENRVLVRVLRFATERRRREALSQATHKLREQIWQMEKAEDIQRVVVALRDTLAVMEMPIHDCSVNVVDSEGDIPAVWANNMSAAGDWVEAPVAMVDVLMRIWLGRAPVYRADLERDDPFGERSFYRAAGGQVRSALDIPFTHGTLSLTSTSADAFSEDDVAALESIVAVLGEGFRRMDDIKALEGRNRELESANTDLARFARVAAHDLQEPLHGVARNLDQYRRQFGGKLGDEADELIAGAGESANRMSRMIDGLRGYSGVRTSGGDFVAISAEALFERLLETRRELLESLAAEITHDRLPTVIADETQLGFLLAQLLDNAIQFRSEETLRIHVTAERSREAWTFCVKDNGVGVSGLDTERIFEVFQRGSRGGDEEEGTGMGLAICKSIVERHGGRMWVESSGGSTFYFTIPTNR